MALQYGLRHPRYEERSRRWTYNLDHYLGGCQLVSKGSDYLSQFDMEADTGFKARLERAEGLYENLMKRSLLVYQSQVWRREPERTLPPALKAIEANVDLQGIDARAFFESVTDDKELFGIGLVLVDAPAIPEGATEADAQSLNARPFFERIRPWQLVDWDVELEDPTRRGQLRFAVIEDSYVRGRSPFMPGDKIQRLRVFERGVGFRILERSTTPTANGAEAADFVETGSGSIPGGMVPLVPCYADRQQPFEAITIFDDVALKANALWNRSSVRDESFYYQGFSQLFIFSDSAALAKLKLGQDRAIKLSQGSDAKYLSPDASLFDAYANFADELTRAVGDIVFARTSRDQKASGQVESAEKRDIDRAEFITLLQAKATANELCETECWRMAGRYLGMSDSQLSAVTVAYTRDFKVTDSMADEWVKRVQEGVASRVEWRMSLHPEETVEMAKAAVEENLAEENKRSPVQQQNDAAQRTLRDAIMARAGAASGEDGAGDSGDAGDAGDQAGAAGKPPLQ